MADDEGKPLTLDGLEDAGLTRRGRARRATAGGKAKKAGGTKKRKPGAPAAHDPIAHVMLDEQATHLGRAFDYLIPEKMSEKAVPGARVRVPFGTQRKEGVIWTRDATTDIKPQALRPLASVASAHPVLDEAMRRDIEAIADAFGGTIPNILRLAVPPRVAYVDAARGKVRTRRAWGTACVKADEEQTARIGRLYENADDLTKALETPEWGWEERTEAPRIIWDSLPGTDTWADDVAWAALHALRAGRHVIVMLPDTRHVAQVRRSMQAMGLRPFAPAATQTPPGATPHTNGAAQDADSGTAKTKAPSPPWQGDFAILLGSDPNDMRYREYLALADGAVRCAIGTRSAMYAPTGGNPVLIVVDDMAYQNADGFMPYPNVRGVAEVRARQRRGLLVVAGHARSALSQADCARGDATVCQVHGGERAVAGLSPQIVWLDRGRLEEEGDPTPGARIPVTVMQWLRGAADGGPVLVSIPEDSPVESLICASCHARARCARCAGPLVRPQGGGGVRCLWCGVPAAPWTCRECGGRRLSAPRPGARSTIGELAGLFRGVPLVASSKVQGVVPRIADAPCLVVATPWFEPFIEGGGEYRAAMILDAWESRYAPGLDARVDFLLRWMHAASLVQSALDGGRVVLLGDTFPELGKSLVAWDPRILGAVEVGERAEAGLPPSVVAAAVWGARDAVGQALLDMGALDGDLAEVVVGGEELPAVLGPVPIREARGVREALDLDWDFEGTGDARGRVRAVVRVEPSRAGELALRLRRAAARVAAAGYKEEFRFQMCPKDLI